MMLCSAVAGVGLTVVAAPKVSDATLVRVAPMGAAPVIDGTIGYEEEHGATMQYGAISDETGLMALRLCVFHFGYTDKGVYFAARTSVPKKPQTLNADDTVTLELLLPGASESRKFTVRVMDGSLVQTPQTSQTPQTVESASRILKGTRDYGVLCAETELFVPYSALGGTLKDGDKVGLQMIVDFTSKKERARWHHPKVEKVAGVEKVESNEMGTLVVDRTAATPSLVNFYTLEQYRASGNYRPFFRFNNKYGKRVKFASKTVVFRGVGHSKLDSNPELDQKIVREEMHNLNNLVAEAGECKEAVYLLWVVNSGAVAVMNVDVSDGAPLFRRQVRWDLNKGLDWEDPLGLPTVQSAFFPCRSNFLRIEFNPHKTDELCSGSVSVVGTKLGKTYWKADLAKGDKIPYQKFNFNLPDLPEDDYEVRFEGSNGAGRTYADKSTFQVASFPWQKAKVGMDRIIVPPYRPIRVEEGESGESGRPRTSAPTNYQLPTTISFLQTGYKCGGILWDQAYGKGEELLAGPVTMKLNGEEFKVQSSTFKEVSPDRVVREVTAVLEVEGEKMGGPRSVAAAADTEVGPPSTISLVVTQDYDYDGFCRVRFAFSSAEKVEVKSLQLRIPLKDELAKYVNVLNHVSDRRAGPAPDCTLKAGEGEVWNSKMDNESGWQNNYPAYTQPYIWWGGVYKGFCWITDCVKNWSLKKGEAAQRIVRKDGAAALECDFVTVPAVWRGEKVFEMGFQPTPVRPKEPGMARLAELMYNYDCPSNAVRIDISWPRFQLSCLHNPHGLYPNGDTSLRDWTYAQKKIDEKAYLAKLDEYIARNRRAIEENPSTSVADFRAGRRHEARGMGIDLGISYMDPMLITSFWPEWEMYKSEWWPLEWPEDNYVNEYMAQVCESRIDKLMWDGMKTLEGGSWGLYYDCFRSCGAFGLASPNVYLKPDGTIQAQLSNSLMWRDIMKRSAVICYKMGRTFCGRPCVEDHDTNGCFVPFMSFCMSGLSTERSSEGGDFQDRFSESYTLVNVIGAQSGKATRTIVSTCMGDDARRGKELKSLMGWMCAYGIFTLNDQGITKRDWFAKAWNLVFDFGWGLPEVKQSYYWDDQPKPVTHTGNDVRLTVGVKKDAALLMFGNLGDDADIAFDVAGLGFGKDVKLTDAETGAALAEPKLRIDRHGYRMVRVDRL